MTKDELNEHVAYWKKALGLNQWQIAVKIEDPSSDDHPTLMSVDRHHLYDDGILKVHPWCVGESEDPPTNCIEEAFLDDEFVEYKVVHELLHFAYRDLAQITVTLDGYLHRDVYEQYEKQVDRAEEQMVDRLAKALVAQRREEKE